MVVLAIYALAVSNLPQGKRTTHPNGKSFNRSFLCLWQIWDLESKVVVDELRPEFPEVSAKAIVPYCTCLCWSNNGSILYSG